MKNDIMRKLIISLSVVLLSEIIFTSCTKKIKKDSSSGIEFKISQFPVEKLNADLSLLSANEKKMIPFLMKACDIMDELYWQTTVSHKVFYTLYLAPIVPHECHVQQIHPVE